MLVSLITTTIVITMFSPLLWLNKSLKAQKNEKSHYETISTYDELPRKVDSSSHVVLVLQDLNT